MRPSTSRSQPTRVIRPRPRSQHPRRLLLSRGSLRLRPSPSPPVPCPDRRPEPVLQLDGFLHSVLYAPAFSTPSNKAAFGSGCNHCPRCASKTCPVQACLTKFLQARQSLNDVERSALWVGLCFLICDREITLNRTRRSTVDRAHPVTPTLVASGLRLTRVQE